MFFGRISEAVAKRCFEKKVLLKISQNAQENTCVRVSFLANLHASICIFIKKKTLYQKKLAVVCVVFFNENKWVSKE